MLDLVAAAVLALSPLVLGLDHVLPIVILEAAAVAMVWLALRTEWRTAAEAHPSADTPPPLPARPRAAPAPRRLRRTAPAGSARRRRPPSAGPGARPAAPLARKLGAAAGKARDDGPRQLGRLVGQAQRAAKAAMSPRPVGSGPRPSEPAWPEPPEPPGADPPP